MAIGDAVSTFLGTAETSYQPTSGVEVQISAVAKEGTTDVMRMSDGSNQLLLIAAAVKTGETSGTSASAYQDKSNMSIMITNSMWIIKIGTTDRMWVGGVQTNA